MSDHPRQTRRTSRGLRAALVVLAVALAVGALVYILASQSNGPSTAFPGCPLRGDKTVAPIAMAEPACATIASDTRGEADPERFWGALQCAADSRYRYVRSGGDPHVTAAGITAPDPGYRRLTVLDGDDFYGERCELGEDDWRTGPTAYYREGDHYVTYISERLPDNFPLATHTWQTVMQMKQTEPSDVGGGSPIIEMEAREHRWVIDDDWHELWSFPARRNRWTRFAWDVYYSDKADRGWLQVSADLNGDGDFDDPGERSPVFHLKTLKTEVEGPNGDTDGIAAGRPVPSHLRAGIYHNPKIHCPAPNGCSVEVDNVEVLGPAAGG
jgi:hypothetical protein